MVQTLFKKVDDVATEAVRRLDIEAFIAKNLDTLYEKLEEADRSVPPDDDIRFVAVSEEMVRTVIYFATGRKDALDAMAWVREAWKNKTRDPDPMTILAMLSLMYIVKEGMKHSDANRQETWRRFSTRLAAVTEQDDQVLPTN
jgi:hypothetical protein